MPPLIPETPPDLNLGAELERYPVLSRRDLDRAPGPPQSPLPPPAARVVAVAKSDPTPLPEGFEPSAAHRALAASLFETGASTFLELAEKSGVSRAHLYRILEDTQAVKWIVANAAAIHKGALPAVYAQLLHKALNDRGTSAIRLFLERFDPEFKPKDDNALRATNMQVNNFNGYSTAELENIVQLKTRSVLGGPTISSSNDRAPQKAQE